MTPEEGEEIAPLLTPEELAKIGKEDAELFQRWSERLSKEELEVRLQSCIDVYGQMIDAAEVEIEGLRALLWMIDHGYDDLWEGVRALNAKKRRTPEEDRALRNFVRYLQQSAKEPPSH
jgi:hypothetical protein